MRKLVAHLQTTLNNRIATASGTFWEPFPWGQDEIRYVNQAFAAADTWVMSRPMYDVIAPWWDVVAAGGVPEDAADLGAAEREFGEIYAGLTKVVFSTTLPPAAGRTVLRGDLAGQLAELKALEFTPASAAGGSPADGAAGSAPEGAGGAGADEDAAGALGAGGESPGTAEVGVDGASTNATPAGTPSAAGEFAAGAAPDDAAPHSEAPDDAAPHSEAPDDTAPRDEGPRDEGPHGEGPHGAAVAAGRGGGRDIVLSCGPATLAPLAAAPGLIDEYLLVIHPAIVAEGRPMFGGLTADIALELRESKVFDGGAVVLRYAVIA